MITTFRLSPKNQVTIPAEGRSLLPEGERTFHAIAHVVPQAEGSTQTYPIVVMLSPAEIRRREERIRADTNLTPFERDRRSMQLRATARQLTMDDQNRVVLPEPLVAHLGLDKDVFFIPLNDSLRVWNPEHYRRWSGLDAGLVDPSLSTYLLA